MAGFTPIWNSILSSTIWLEEPHVKVVWLTMLFMADRRGIVEGSVPGIAKEAVVPIEACRQALGVLLAPDPESRTQEHEGRRIAAIDGGWQILNYQKHRDKLIASSRDRVRRFRERKAKG